MEIENYNVTTCIQSEHLETIRRNAEKKDSIADRFVRGYKKLSEADFRLLTPSEKFIYAHQYPESYMQVCGLHDIEKDLSKICANIPYLFDGSRISERQRKSLQDNRDTSMACLRSCINFDSHIPLGYKQTILTINAWELIPSILALEDKMNKGVAGVIKDTYVYSLLMVLMKDNAFAPFTETGIYKDLYGPESGYRAKINYTVAIRNQLIQLADKFYTSKMAIEQVNR